MSGIYDNVPRINPNRFPEKEQQSAYACESCLRDIASCVRDFKYALALGDFCAFQMRIQQANPRPGLGEELFPWQLIACRDGAMTIYHFAKAMDGANTWAKTCPTMSPLIDHAHLKNAFKLLGSYFANFEAVRHAVAHSSELIKNRKWIDEHSFTGSYQSENINLVNVNKLVMRNVIEGRTFTSTFNGSIQSYEMSQATLDKLSEIATEFYLAFIPVESV